MIIQNLENINTNFFDYTVVGSGPAGITLSLQLARKNKKVLLIEAGGLYFSENSQLFYKGETFGDKYFQLDITRLRYFGGSSGHWAGACRTLDEVDFQSWPISKKSLDNFEKKAKEILNIKGNFYSKQSEFNNFNNINLLRSDVQFGEKYKSKIEKSNNIFLLLNSPLLQIIPDKQNYKKVREILINVNNLKKEKIKINNLVLATGGIENSRILLWSRYLSKNNFLENLPIGNYWNEHPAGEIAQFVSERTKDDPLIKKFLGSMIAPVPEFINKNNINNIRLDFLEYGDITKKYFKHYIKDLVCLAPNFGKKVFESVYKKQPVHCFAVVKFSAEQKPSFENRIQLSNNLDSNGIPKVSLHWNIDDDVFESLEILLQNLGEQLIKKEYGRIGIDRYVFDKSFKNSKDIFASHHHIGGTVMGIEKNNSVVDKNFKVHDVDNLYILGSSIFKSGGHANPTFSIVQLSLKLADYLNSSA